jgi:hypothetical protein
MNWLPKYRACVRESKTSKTSAIFSPPSTLLKAAPAFRGNRRKKSLASTNQRRVSLAPPSRSSTRKLPRWDAIPTLRSLSLEVQSLRERVEDLEDARDLEEAIRKNGDRPLIPWEQAKKTLDLD